MDAVPLIGRTGIGNIAYYTLRALLNVEDRLFYTLYYIQYNQRVRKPIEKFVGERVRCRYFRLPSRLTIPWWSRIKWPPIEWFVGRADIVHGTNQFLPPSRHAKKVLTIYDLTALSHPSTHTERSRWVAMSSIGVSLERADLVISISQNTSKELVQWFQYPEERIRIVYPGVDFKRFHPLGASDDLEKEKTVLHKYCIPDEFMLCIGTLEPRKNIERLIEACHLLKQNGISIPPLVLIGGRGWLYNTIFKKVIDLKMQDEVIFAGFIGHEDLPVILRLSYLFVYPSLYEGFGIPPLEAMASAVPVVTSNVSSLPEVVGNTAIMVNPLSVESIANGIRKGVEEAALRDYLIVKGLERAQDFTWERTARDTLSVYRELI
jgi:glycosyltransferase involved in cell wall biosynthesis